MRMSEEGLRFLVGLEGYRAKPYRDQVNKLTIGVGHLITYIERKTGLMSINGKLVRWGQGLTKKQVYDLLAQDLARFEKTVYDSLAWEPEQNEFDALVCLAFNIGEGAFLNSTLLKKLNAQDWPNVPLAWRMWRKAGGRVLQGLVARREKELNLFFGEESDVQVLQEDASGTLESEAERGKIRADLGANDPDSGNDRIDLSGPVPGRGDRQGPGGDSGRSGPGTNLGLFQKTFRWISQFINRRG